MTSRSFNSYRFALGALSVAVLLVSFCAARSVATFAAPCHGQAGGSPCAALSSQNWLPAQDGVLGALAICALLLAAAFATFTPSLVLAPAPRRIATFAPRAGPASRRYASISPRAP